MKVTGWMEVARRRQGWGAPEGSAAPGRRLAAAGREPAAEVPSCLSLAEQRGAALRLLALLQGKRVPFSAGARPADAQSRC